MEAIKEDVPANNVSAGNIAGVGADTHDNILNIVVVDKDKIKERKKEEKKDENMLTPENSPILDKKQFKENMNNVLRNHIYIKEDKDKELPNEVKQRLLKSLHLNKDKAELQDTETAKKEADEEDKKLKHSNLYIWQTSPATEEKVKKVIKDFNDSHPHHKLYTRLYSGSQLTRFFVSGDPLSRKQIASQIESSGGKKYQ